jgi:hypothetical protein
VDSADNAGDAADLKSEFSSKLAGFTLVNRRSKVNQHELRSRVYQRVVVQAIVNLLAGHHSCQLQAGINLPLKIKVCCLVSVLSLCVPARGPGMCVQKAIRDSDNLCSCLTRIQECWQAPTNLFMRPGIAHRQWFRMNYPLPGEKVDGR